MSRGNGIWAFGVLAVVVFLFTAGCGTIGPTTSITTTIGHPPKGPVKHQVNGAGGVSQPPVAGSAASVVHTASSLFKHIDQPSGAQTGVTRPASAAIGKTSGQSLQTAVQSKSIKPSEAELITPYVAELDTLRGQYLSSVSALFNQARADYHNGKGTKLAIEGAYLPRLGALENSAQNQVNSVLFTLRAQLQANGYSSDEVNVLRSDYYSEVQHMMAAIRK